MNTPHTASMYYVTCPHLSMYTITIIITIIIMYTCMYTEVHAGPCMVGAALIGVVYILHK